jgi:hypothetical protein
LLWWFRFYEVALKSGGFNLEGRHDELGVVAVTALVSNKHFPALLVAIRCDKILVHPMAVAVAVCSFAHSVIEFIGGGGLYIK